MQNIISQFHYSATKLDFRAKKTFKFATWQCSKYNWLTRAEIYQHLDGGVLISSPLCNKYCKSGLHTSVHLWYGPLGSDPCKEMECVCFCLFNPTIIAEPWSNLATIAQNTLALNHFQCSHSNPALLLLHYYFWLLTHEDSNIRQLNEICKAYKRYVDITYIYIMQVAGETCNRQFILQKTSVLCVPTCACHANVYKDDRK